MPLFDFFWKACNTAMYSLNSTVYTTRNVPFESFSEITSTNLKCSFCYRSIFDKKQTIDVIIVSMKNIILYFFTILLCGACATYHAGSPIPELFLITSNTEKSEQIQALLKVYSSAESKQYFGINLLAANILPVQIQVANPTARTFRIQTTAPSSCLSTQEIVTRAGASPKGAASLAILPGILTSIVIAPFIAIVTVVAACASGAPGDPTILCALGAAVAAVPAGMGLVSGKNAYNKQTEYNQKLRDDLEQKILHNTIIRPFSNQNGVLFFDIKHMPKDTRLTLIDTESQETVGFTASSRN